MQHIRAGSFKQANDDIGKPCLGIEKVAVNDVERGGSPVRVAADIDKLHGDALQSAFFANAAFDDAVYAKAPGDIPCRKATVA